MGEMRQKSKVAAKDRGEQMRTDNGSKVLGGARGPQRDLQPTAQHMGLEKHSCDAKTYCTFLFNSLDTAYRTEISFTLTAQFYK